VSLTLPSVASLDELRQCLYSHVMEAIDWGKIHGYEQMLWSLLPELGHDDDEGELAEAMIRECVVRAASDPMRNFSEVPYGITEAERKAVEYDDGCVFCRADAVSGDGDEEHVDDCPCCADLAADWRAQHETVLRKAGLWRPPPS
jgi:hypothetical protein